MKRLLNLGLVALFSAFQTVQAGAGSELVLSRREISPITDGADGLATAAVIIDSNNSADLRLKSVRSLPQNLGEQETALLFDFIRAIPGNNEKSRATLTLIKNDLLNSLLNQPRQSAQLVDVMIATFLDQGQDQITRDYVLQHLITWYERSSSDETAARLKVRHILSQALLEKNGISGTALSGLHRLTALDPQIDRFEIKKYALSLAQPDALAVNRITAFQVCGEEGIVEILPLIRASLLPQTPIPLQISAIAVLGQLGDDGEVPLLKNLEADPVLQSAVKTALKHNFHRQRLE